MATLQLEISEPIVRWYTNATNEQKQHITQVVADILMLLSNNATKPFKNQPSHLILNPLMPFK